MRKLKKNEAAAMIVFEESPEGLKATIECALIKQNPDEEALEGNKMATEIAFMLQQIMQQVEVK